MPFYWCGAEPLSEAFKPLGAERNLRQQDEGLSILMERFGHRLEIYLRLSRARDPVYQDCAKAARLQRVDQTQSRRTLIIRKFGSRVIGIRRRRYR